MSNVFEINVIHPQAWKNDDNGIRIVCDGLQSELIRHVKAAPEYFHDVSLSVTFEKLHQKRLAASVLCTELVIVVSGTVNGENFQQRWERDIADSGGAIRGTLLANTGVVGWAAQKAVENVMDTPNRGMEEFHARKLRDEILLELLTRLDAAVNRPANSYAAYWYIILAASFSMFLIATAASAMLLEKGTSDHSVKAWSRGGLAMGAIVALPVLFATLVFGMVSMPREFFENETFGKKLIAFTGAKSSNSIKPVCIFIGISFLAITAFILWLSTPELWK